MKGIRHQMDYEAICERIEELLQIVDDNTPIDNKDFIELDILSDLVVDYETLLNLNPFA
ncbi:XRE family transcriptional regulator [Myroides marinus]|jgi:HTH-type transcriptional regulator/antitoxin HigA|uniref:HTH-type transcriptional regulator / antitoxin HigA n=1 Tax=Myroides marinus TaxID=703342 RepID=A0A1H6U7W5_9FLAO|nr:XRE family transcriptional regulator [Myroides marinus]MDR0196468.1 XRE family transcriptional regulator [Myroides sp.]MDM1347268.1 XRE family transcriptional regulator [Myroides marinus]MDM1350262.1 XRE family transcriptional regulator [Myroides marinus]MDM1354066.1 XRE family transcriptional regulator [Myroides marinus]MDM1357469.1 XRE family transcriptional regulator [Myroides marinus]